MEGVILDEKFIMETKKGARKMIKDPKVVDSRKVTKGIQEMKEYCDTFKLHANLKFIPTMFTFFKSAS